VQYKNQGKLEKSIENRNKLYIYKRCLQAKLIITYYKNVK